MQHMTSKFNINHLTRLHSSAHSQEFHPFLTNIESAILYITRLSFLLFSFFASSHYFFLASQVRQILSKNHLEERWKPALRTFLKDMLNPAGGYNSSSGIIRNERVITEPTFIRNRCYNLFMDYLLTIKTNN